MTRFTFNQLQEVINFSDINFIFTGKYGKFQITCIAVYGWNNQLVHI